MGYKITDNVIALSRAWTYLNTVFVSGIPQVDVGDEIDVMACELVAQLGSKEESLNGFFQAVTTSEDDFSKMSQLEVINVAVNFCKSINNPFLKLIKRFLKESKELSDMAIVKMKLMQIEQMKDLTKNLLEDPEKYAHILKSLPTSDSQD